MVVAGMVLMGGALGMFGDMRLAATNQVFPRATRTEQEHHMAYVVNNDGRRVTMNNLRFVARGRSRDGDPCIPTAPVAFSARVPVIC